MTIRFDGQVALVTGGGRGMGREHCLLLAKRGASVVVNDLGVAMEGHQQAEDPATAVAEEIRAAGGQAVANHDDVGSRDGPATMVQNALDHFGRIDIIVHNAGIVTFAPFADLTYDQYRALVNVHLDGGFLLAKAAWPHMVRQQYGRLVFITSQAALSGVPNLAHYAVAKTGLTGLARALALEGEPLGIRANTLGVTALTRMMTGFFHRENEGQRPVNAHMNANTEEWWANNMRPDQVSPVLAWLASRECDVNGRIIDTAGGYTVHQYLATTRGYFDAEGAPENVHEHRAEILDRDDAQVFDNAGDLSQWRNAEIQQRRSRSRSNSAT